MPAVKKDSSVRARRNRASSAAVLPAVVARVSVPSLPRRKWSPLTRRWWSDLWCSPMSSEYHGSDVHQLYLLAMLMDDFFCAVSATGRKELAGEIRLHRAAFGLTPYDRRRLEWTIELAEDAKDRGVVRRTRKSPAGGADPRGLLSVVS